MTPAVAEQCGQTFSTLQQGMPALSFSISRKTARFLFTLQRSLAAGTAGYVTSSGQGNGPQWRQKRSGGGVGEEHPLDSGVLKHELLLWSESRGALSHTVSKLCPFGVVQNEILPRSAGWEARGGTQPCTKLWPAFTFPWFLPSLSPLLAIS